MQALIGDTDAWMHSKLDLLLGSHTSKAQQLLRASLASAATGEGMLQRPAGIARWHAHSRG